MTKRNKDLLKNIGSVIIIIGFIAYIYFGNKHRQMIMDDEKTVYYTICEVTDYRIGYKVSPSLAFFFFVNNERIEDEDTLGKGQQQDNLNVYKGKHYLVRFSTKDPKFYNEIVWNKAVPDSLVQCCRKQVWDELPF